MKIVLGLQTTHWAYASSFKPNLIFILPCWSSVATLHAKFDTVGGAPQFHINFRQLLAPDGDVLDEAALDLCNSSKAKW